MLWLCTPDAVFVDRHVAEKYNRENAKTRQVYEREKLLYYVMSVRERCDLSTLPINYSTYYIFNISYSIL